MKTEKNILMALLLNLGFSILEFIGGILTNSIAIISDSIHDLGDALSIGISFVLEKISKRKPDEKYTYGYSRYSILGAFITTTILIVGSIFVIYGAINRIMNPIEINYDGMIIIALFGSIINFIATYFTKNGDSLNQKAVNLHMLEDVFGWIIVLIGSIIMKFTDITIIDSIMSIGLALFILLCSIKNLKSIADLFLEKIPSNISIDEINNHVSNIKGICNIHHIHVWSIDGINNYATMHVITNRKDFKKIKEEIKNELSEHNISHVTIEIEDEKENCTEKNCSNLTKISSNHHHHH